MLCSGYATRHSSQAVTPGQQAMLLDAFGYLVETILACDIALDAYKCALANC